MSLAHALASTALVDPHSVSASPSHLPGRATGLARPSDPPIDGVEEGRQVRCRQRSSRKAPFLSLRRGERWRCEAATDWGNHMAIKRRADQLRQSQKSLHPVADPTQEVTSVRQTGFAKPIDEMLAHRVVAEWLCPDPVAGREMRVADEEHFDLGARLVEPAELGQACRQETA